MTVTFFSSVLNHHQISFCDAVRQMPNVTFHFVQAIDLTPERKAQGFHAIEAPYVVRASEEPERAYKLCMESDVVIAGVIDQSWVNARVAQGKLTFAYKERFCKARFSRLRPGFWKNGYLNYFRYRNKNLYLLCASSYTSRDTRLIFPRQEKKRKWGYFPQINMHADREVHLNAKMPGTILWVGRFLPLKHPESCVTVAKTLKNAGILFRLDMIGLGQMETALQEMVRQENLEDCIHFLGQMPPEQVREQMGKHEIFLFTSDQNEGWGAVLNEAMSEGCACISSKQAGSTDFLIRDGENGFSFDYRDVDTLTKRTAQLLEDTARLRSMQTKAMETIENAWNAETAARRLMEFCDAWMEGRKLPQYADGPMSRVK